MGFEVCIIGAIVFALALVLWLCDRCRTPHIIHHPESEQRWR